MQRHHISYGSRMELWHLRGFVSDFDFASLSRQFNNWVTLSSFPAVSSSVTSPELQKLHTPAMQDLEARIRSHQALCWWYRCGRSGPAQKASLISFRDLTPASLSEIEGHLRRKHDGRVTIVKPEHSGNIRKAKTVQW